MDRLNLKIPPAILVFAFAVIMWLLAHYLPGAYQWPEAKTISQIILALGAVSVATGVWCFKTAKTTVDPMHPERASTVVQNGIYRVSRNPMYLGFFLVLTAWAMALQHWVPWLLLPVFVVYMNRFQIKPEEQALQDMFGADYLRYCQKVRRWL